MILESEDKYFALFICKNIRKQGIYNRKIVLQQSRFTGDFRIWTRQNEKVFRKRDFTNSTCK